ncbi:hypothetical protein THAOC_08393, partial [Thalassiosira oceanica]
PDGSSDEDDDDEDGGFDCPFEIKAEKSPFGPGTVYTTNEEVHHSVTYPEKYFNRGEGLKDLTLDEYLRLVRIERIRGEDKDEDKQPKTKLLNKSGYMLSYDIHKTRTLRSFQLATGTLTPRCRGHEWLFLGLGVECFSVRKRLTGRRHLRGSFLFPFLFPLRSMSRVHLS